MPKPTTEISQGAALKALIIAMAQAIRAAEQRRRDARS